MKKILFVVEDITFSGGLENVILKLSDYFVENDFFEVEILSLKNKNGQFYNINEKITLQSLKIPHFHSGDYKFCKIKKYTRDNKGDFVDFFSTNVIYDYIIATTYPIASLLNAVETSSIKIVWEHTHYYGYCDPVEHYAGLKGKVRKIYNRFITHPGRAKLYNKLQSVIVLTAIDKANWQEKHHNVMVINNPLTLPVITKSLNTPKKRFITIGRLTQQKGYSYLIDAFNLSLKSGLCDKYQLFIVGDGPLKSELQDKVVQLGLEKHVFLLGLRKDVATLLDESEVYISTSIYEGFGLTLVEAQSRGLPIIAFDCLAGPREIIKNDAGILVENRNIKELARNINGLVKNKRTIKEMSLSALNNSKRFDINVIAHQWKTHLESLKNES